MATIVQAPGRPSTSRAQTGAAVAARLDADPRMQRLPGTGVEAWRCPGFLDDAQCDWLVQMIEANRRPSTLLTDRGTSPNRTSDSCDMDRSADGVARIDGLIAETLGIAPDHGETMQGQRYALGQHFRAHHDYFRDTESYWPRMRDSGGQRTWTAMIYLNHVEEGGATWFPEAGVRVAPRKGLLLCWNNMAGDGSPNPRTVHEGMPVVEGVKHIVTKWFREQPWGRRG